MHDPRDLSTQLNTDRRQPSADPTEQPGEHASLPSMSFDPRANLAAETSVLFQNLQASEQLELLARMNDQLTPVQVEYRATHFDATFEVLGSIGAVGTSRLGNSVVRIDHRKGDSSDNIGLDAIISITPEIEVKAEDRPAAYHPNYPIRLADLSATVAIPGNVDFCGQRVQELIVLAKEQNLFDEIKACKVFVIIHETYGVKSPALKAMTRFGDQSFIQHVVLESKGFVLDAAHSDQAVQTDIWARKMFLPHTLRNESIEVQQEFLRTIQIYSFDPISYAGAYGDGGLEFNTFVTLDKFLSPQNPPTPS